MCENVTGRNPVKSQGEGAGVAGAFRLQCRPDAHERREGGTPEYRELCLQGPLDSLRRASGRSLNKDCLGVHGRARCPASPPLPRLHQCLGRAQGECVADSCPPSALPQQAPLGDLSHTPARSPHVTGAVLDVFLNTWHIGSAMKAKAAAIT